MVKDLQRVGFDFQPKLKPFPNSDYENRNKTVLTGVVAADKALRCLSAPHVAALLLMPTDYQLPEDPAAPVRVRLELAGGLAPQRQQELANQVRAVLGQFDFKESTGYDHRGYGGRPFTRLVGTLPAEYLQAFPAEFGKIAVEEPPLILKDLRQQPTGWLAPRLDPETLPAPVNERVPIIVTEVVPESEPAR